MMGEHTTATFSGAHRLDVLGRLPRIEEGHVRLGADRVYGPVQTVRQAHVLFAVRKLRRELLKTKNSVIRMRNVNKNTCRNKHRREGYAAEGRILYLTQVVLGLP